MSLDKRSGPSIDTRIAWSSVLSPILLRNRVLISFILLKVRSTVAVVTGSTIKIAASFAKFGNAAMMSALFNKIARTWCKELCLCCTNMTLRNSFHSASVLKDQHLVVIHLHFL